MSSLIYSESGGISTITINRPEVLNSLDLETIQLLEKTFSKIEKNDDIKVVILKSAGNKAFCAGLDINLLNKPQIELMRDVSWLRITEKMEEMSKVIITQVGGLALGAGFELCLASDIVIASDKAQFGLPEISLGILPGMGGTQRLPRQIGVKRALYLMLTGSRISAKDAEKWGIVNIVVPENDLEDTSNEIAKEIAKKSPLAIANIKKVVKRGIETDLITGLLLEKLAYLICAGSIDKKEGVNAFIEKREPNFAKSFKEYW